MSDNEVMVVFTNAVEGREDEFNAWYSGQHVPDVLAVEGFVAARRYCLADMDSPQKAPYRYLAIYEVEPGRAQEARAALTAAVKAGMAMSDSLAEVQGTFYSPIGERPGV